MKFLEEVFKDYQNVEGRTGMQMNDDEFSPFQHSTIALCFLFVCFVALRPKSTAMVMAGQSVHLTTLFSWAGLNKQLTSTSCTYLCS